MPKASGVIKRFYLQITIQEMSEAFRYNSNCKSVYKQNTENKNPKTILSIVTIFSECKNIKLSLFLFYRINFGDSKSLA